MLLFDDGKKLEKAVGEEAAKTIVEVLERFDESQRRLAGNRIAPDEGNRRRPSRNSEGQSRNHQMGSGYHHRPDSGDHRRNHCLDEITRP